jgi:Bacterial SH3 domain
MTAHIRKEISPQSALVATLAHGDKVDVLEQRRIFAHVRTADGHEGWIDVKQLMTKEQMNELRALNDQAAALPSQGAAVSYDPVNMHTTPDRNSPSFFQFREGTRVEVLAHKLAPRLPRASAPPTRLLPVKPKIEKRKAQSDETDGRRRLRVPAAPAPGLPGNWRELSKTGDAETPGAASKPPPEQPPVPMEDWTLVRTKDGAAGWVLTRMLVMSIPDEVAQYSEGHRITAYFAMAEVRDGDRVKYDWLWTTQSQTDVPYDFDSFRYFVWNPRHHQYETGYIQRNVVGYYPVKVTPGAQPKFSMILQDDDGKLYRNDFVLQGYHVRRASKVPWTAPAAGAVTQQSPGPAPAAPPVEHPGFIERMRDKIRGWLN